MIMKNDKIDEIKKTAKRFDGIVYSIDEAVLLLELARAYDENIYIDFNGRLFYSLLDDKDSVERRLSLKQPTSEPTQMQ